MELRSVLHLLGDIRHNLSNAAGYLQSNRHKFRLSRLEAKYEKYVFTDYKIVKRNGETHLKIRLWFPDLEDAVEKLQREYGRKVFIKAINRQVMELFAHQDTIWDIKHPMIFDFISRLGGREISDFEWVGTDYDEDELAARGLRR